MGWAPSSIRQSTGLQPLPTTAHPDPSQQPTEHLPSLRPGPQLHEGDGETAGAALLSLCLTLALLGVENSCLPRFQVYFPEI